MCGEGFASFLDRFDERVAEFLILEMRAHRFHKSLPELPAAFFVDPLVAYHRKLMRMGSNENEHRVALVGSVHAQSVKFLLRGNKRIGLQFSTLNVNANLARRF